MSVEDVDAVTVDHSTEPDDGRPEDGVDRRHLVSREIAIYEQNNFQSNQINQLMWKVPFFAIVITGGLWYGAFLSRNDQIIRLLLFTLAFAANIALSLVVLRLRVILEGYLRIIRDFDRNKHPDPSSIFIFKSSSLNRLVTRPNFVAKVFIILMMFVRIGIACSNWGRFDRWHEK